MKWQIELLAKRHDRGAFDCGVEPLNHYLQSLASQHARRNISRTYVAVPEEGGTPGGFYSLSTGSIRFEALPEAVRKKLPRYPIPTAHLGQLAVDRSYQGEGLGASLLFDALQRVVRAAEELGIYAVTVDAINDAAIQFYVKHGFFQFEDLPQKLYIELKVVRQLTSP